MLVAYLSLIFKFCTHFLSLIASNVGLALPCSRCTGYRPILDAFKAFAKVDAAAYTEEAIAASKANGGTANGTNGKNGSNGKNGKNGSNGKVCPSTGAPCDCGESDGNGTIISASKHKEESCGPLTHTHTAGAHSA